MKTRIYWFSATGNSLAAAKQLADELGGAELQSVPDVPEQGAAREEARVGIVFPVYMFGLPLIVGRFCDRLQVRSDAYVFGVAACGGMPGAAMAQLRGRLTGRGCRSLPDGPSPCRATTPRSTAPSRRRRRRESSRPPKKGAPRGRGDQARPTRRRRGEQRVFQSDLLAVAISSHGAAHSRHGSRIPSGREMQRVRGVREGLSGREYPPRAA